MEEIQEVESINGIDFSKEFFFDFISNFISIFSKIELSLREAVEIDPTQIRTIEELKAKYEEGLPNIGTLISTIENFGLYDTLTVACLSGIYYDFNKSEWIELKEKLKAVSQSIDQIESIVTITNQQNITELEIPTIEPTELEELFDEVYYDIFDDHIDTLTTGFSEFKESLILFINLSIRLVFAEESNVPEIQSKHIDFSLNNQLAVLNETIIDSETQKANYIINLRLAELDEFLSCDESFLKELINYSTKLTELYFQSNEQDIFVKITSQKCLFLIYKILSRINKSNKLTNDGVYISAFYNEHKSDISTAGIKKTLHTEQSPYNYFLEKSDSLYDPMFKNFTQIHPPNDWIKFSIEEIHINCKLLQYMIKRGNEIDTQYNNYVTVCKELLAHKNVIKDKLKISDRDTQLFSSTSVKYLLLNTLFYDELSQMIRKFDDLKNLDSTFNKLLKIFDSYNSQCDFTQNQNLLFPNIQLLRYFIICVENLFEKTTDIIANTRDIFDTTEIERVEKSLRDVVVKVGEVTKIFFKYLVILKNKNYYPIYNDLKCCKTEKYQEFPIYFPKLNSETGAISDEVFIIVRAKIFLDSSYVRPANYSFLKFNMEERIRSINNTNSQILSLLEVFLTKNIEKTLEQKVKENQYNAIQILSVYAIVITYILGSITSLPKFEGGLKIMPYFMILLALILGFFIICIRFLFINEKFHLPFRIPFTRINKIPRWLLFAGFMTILATLILRFVLPKFEEIKIENTKFEFNRTTTRDTVNVDSLRIQYMKTK